MVIQGMKKLYVLIVLVFIIQYAIANDSEISGLYENKISNVQVNGSGVVIWILPDDLEGSKHQKFIVKLKSGITLLIAHNIDIAPKIETLAINDLVEFYGEYEWNAKGGLVHWTHSDPKGIHENGWLKHRGKKYQ